MVMPTTSLADAKSRLSEIIASAESTHERTTITKNGRPVVVLIAVEDLEEMEESLYWAPQAKEARDEAAHGPFTALMSKDELQRAIDARPERDTE